MASAVKTNKVDKEEELTLMRERTPSAAGALLGQRLEGAPEGDAQGLMDGRMDGQSDERMNQ